MRLTFSQIPQCSGCRDSETMDGHNQSGGKHWRDHFIRRGSERPTDGFILMNEATRCPCVQCCWYVSRSLIYTYSVTLSAPTYKQSLLALKANIIKSFLWQIQLCFLSRAHLKGIFCEVWSVVYNLSVGNRDCKVESSGRLWLAEPQSMSWHIGANVL